MQRHPGRNLAGRPRVGRRSTLRGEAGGVKVVHDPWVVVGDVTHAACAGEELVVDRQRCLGAGAGPGHRYGLRAVRGVVGEDEVLGHGPRVVRREGD